MRTRMFGVVATAASCLSLIAPAQANSLFADFTIFNGGPSAPGSTVIFTLNGDGTIAASLSAISGSIKGFGFDSPAFELPESNFSSGALINHDWYHGLEHFNSGFLDPTNNGVGSNVTWTIGNLGEFSSVWQALGGATTTYDFFLYTAPNSDVWEGNAVVSPTPLPAALPLFAGGLGLIGLLARRRKRKAAALAA